MYLLEKGKYEIIRPLLNSQKFNHTFSYSVIEGKVAGNIFVDNQETPKTVVVEIFNGIHHLFGSWSNIEFNHTLSTWIEKNTKNRSKPFVLFTRPEFEPVIDEWNTSFLKKMRSSLKFQRDLFLAKETPNLPDGYKLCKIDEEMINKSVVYPPRFYEVYWGNVDKFLKYGFGLCLLNEKDEIVCEATSPAVGNSKVDIDIFTSENVRSRGLGKAVAYYFLTHLLENNLTPPDWECDEDNEGSHKLAESLGYVKTGKHPLYILK